MNNRDMLTRILRDSCTVSALFFIVFCMVFSSVFIAVVSGASIISINPESQTVSAGDSIVVSIDCVPERAVKGFELKMSFDPSLLEASSVAEGSFFEGYTTFFNPGTIDNNLGRIVDIYDLIIGAGNMTNPGTLITVEFIAKTDSGTAALFLYDVLVTNETEYIEVTVTSAEVIVEGTSQPSNPPPSEPPLNPPAQENNPPSAPLKPSGPALIEVGMTYVYSSAAVDSDGDRVRLRFDWGDDSLSNWTDFVDSNTTVTVTHTWAAGSTYAVRVIASDESGSNSSWSETLSVVVSQANSSGSPPVVSFVVPLNVTTNQSIFFDSSGSFDPDGVIVSYQWDFGDGVLSTEANPSHLYSTPGQYTVTLTIIDNAGVTVSKSLSVTILDGTVILHDEGTDVLWSNSSVIVMMSLLVMCLVVIFLFRNKMRLLFVKKRIEASSRKIVSLGTKKTDINRILDSLFLENKNKAQSPRTEDILDSYNDFILDNVEKNVAFHVPDLSIEEVERLVDSRIRSKIEEKIDKM